MATPLLDVRVPPSAAGERLDRFIAAECSSISRLQVRRMIAGGSVFVDGQRTGICSRLVRAGQQISCYPLITPRPSEDPRIVLSRDELLIVDKPAGMAVEATRSGSQGTLVKWLASHGGGLVTHRLDAPVSGLCVLGRTKAAQAALNSLFARHAVDRQYLAAVAPAPAWDDHVLEERLDGKPARTLVAVVGRSPQAALLKIRLETGRFRQIRRHLASAGAPVVGDREQPSARVAGRILLHAYRLGFEWHGDHVEAESQPPGEFRAELARLDLTLDESPS